MSDVTSQETLAPVWAELPHTRIAGVPVATASRSDLVAAAITDCRMRREAGRPTRPRLVFDVNGHALSLRETDPDYRSHFDGADVIHADGGFLVTLSRWWTDRPIAERSATTDMIHDFAKAAEEAELTFYLLGASEAVNEAAARRLTELYPRLRIAGRRNGYFTAGDEAAVVDEINACSPDILWVGLGKPKEQAFCMRHREALRAGWAITSGGCFNFLAGNYPRAPMWMQNANLEWLYRMATNPRLIWRYLTTTPHALWLTAMSLRSRS